MHNACDEHWPSPLLSRRGALQAGAIGLALGTGQPAALRAWACLADAPKAKSVIFVFLTGGLSQLDSFDMKPDAPADVRGEFQPIATRTPGIQICEHLPLLAQRSDHYALVRSMQTASSAHEPACHMLLTGRLDLPPGFSLAKVPSMNEWPSIPSLVTYASRERQHLMPPTVVLPEPNINENGKVRPGQYAGLLGSQWDAWHVNIASKCSLGNGACPDCFRFQGTPFEHVTQTIFDTRSLTLPEGGSPRFRGRVQLLDEIQRPQRHLERLADTLHQHRRQAISLLVDPKASRAFDVEHTDLSTRERYGKNKFGLSVLMAKRLIEAGVNLVQVNLGKNSSWDTHEQNFVNLKENLLPLWIGVWRRCLTICPPAVGWTKRWWS